MNGAPGMTPEERVNEVMDAICRAEGPCVNTAEFIGGLIGAIALARDYPKRALEYFENAWDVFEEMLVAAENDTVLSEDSRESVRLADRALYIAREFMKGYVASVSALATVDEWRDELRAIAESTQQEQQ